MSSSSTTVLPALSGRFTATQRQVDGQQSYYAPRWFDVDQEFVLPSNTWAIVQLRLIENSESTSGYPMQHMLHRQLLEMPWVRINLAVGNSDDEEKKWPAGTPLDAILNQPYINSCLLFEPNGAGQTLHRLDFM
jgi:hypothetical protein